MSGESRVVGGYTLEGRIGAGSSATVYRARRGEEAVALKLLHPHLTRDRVVRARFLREVAIARKLSHPAIVRVYDLVAWEGELALVMELCEGGSLAGWRATSADDVIAVATAVAGGLEEAHRSGVIHRDLKPQNLLRDREGRCKICDFGSAGVAESVGLTTSSLLVTAPLYVAPEVFQGQPADPRADLYSLGAILYEAVAGRPPRSRALGGEPPDRAGLEALLPAWLVEIVLGLLASADRRIGDAAALLRALKRGGPPRGVELKQCLFCGASIPATSPVCLHCGEEELALAAPAPGEACSLSLRRVSEEAGMLQELTELLRAVSGDPGFELDLLIGDARMYSRQEQKRKTRLPVRVVDGLSPSDAERLKRIFDRIKTRTAVVPERRARRNKRGPLVRPRLGAVRIEAGSETLRSGSALVSALRDPWVKDHASSLLYSVYRLETAAARHELRELLRAPIEELRHEAERCIGELESSGVALAGVDRPALYAQVARSELGGAEGAEGGEGAPALRALERADGAELARSRAAAQLLRVRALTDELAGLLESRRAAADAEAREALAELEEALGGGGAGG